MDDVEVQKQIKTAVLLKRKGDFSGALKIEKECLREYKKNKKISKRDLASLYKSLGKLYYIEFEINNAKKHYKKAIELSFDLNDQLEIQNGLFHLGCCSDKFQNSRYYDSYRSGLISGGPASGEPESEIEADLVKALIALGADIFNEMD